MRVVGTEMRADVLVARERGGDGEAGQVEQVAILGRAAIGRLGRAPRREASGCLGEPRLRPLEPDVLPHQGLQRTPVDEGSSVWCNARARDRGRAAAAADGE